MANRLNPVELVIFAVVATGFGFSAYRLIQQRPSVERGILAPMASNPLSGADRQPAAVAPLFGHVAFGCKANEEQAVKASKVRITGPICGLENSSEKAQVVSATVVNSANQFHATVFTDLGAGKFSTDYIPLNSEKCWSPSFAP
ncbi:hypothetical protein EBZ37_14625 [bacterium]|nr:hypothetical protein [bacterium]